MKWRVDSLKKIKEIKQNLLAKLSTTKKMGNAQINLIRDGKGYFTIDTNEIWRIISTYFKNLHPTKLEFFKGKESNP